MDKCNLKGEIFYDLEHEIDGNVSIKYVDSTGQPITFSCTYDDYTGFVQFWSKQTNIMFDLKDFLKMARMIIRNSTPEKKKQGRPRKT